MSRTPDSLVDSEVVGDFLVELHYDFDGSNDPRGWDNLGTITQCQRSRNYEMTEKDAEYKSNDWEILKEMFKENGVFALPINIRDYGSSVKLYVGDFDPDYEWNDYDHIDAFVYVTRDKLMEEYNFNDPEAAFMYATLIKEHLKDDQGRIQAVSVIEVLKNELETYESYLNGEVYGWVVREGIKNEEDGEINPDDHSGEVIESVWGYVGEREYCMSEGRHCAETETQRRDEADREANWMLAL